MRKLKPTLSYAGVLLLCLGASCLESESRNLDEYQSDKCREAPAGEAILFAGVPWGSSRDQVIAAKGQQPRFADDRTLVFDDHIAGMPVSATFQFASNQLTRGAYFFTAKHAYENRYLEEFNDIEELLKRKYGDPAVSDTTWHNNMFKYVYKDYGLAISLGQMSMLAGWKAGCVKFTHTISGGNGQVRHAIEYHHLKMQTLEVNAGAGAKL